MSRIVVPLAAPTVAGLLERTRQAAAEGADWVEWRLDTSATQGCDPAAAVTALAALTVSVALVGEAAEALKLAVTVRAALIETVQVAAVPVHAPLHPAKVLPLAGLAVRVTAVPEL